MSAAAITFLQNHDTETLFQLRPGFFVLLRPSDDMLYGVYFVDSSNRMLTFPSGFILKHAISGVRCESFMDLSCLINWTQCYEMSVNGRVLCKFDPPKQHLIESSEFQLRHSSTGSSSSSSQLLSYLNLNEFIDFNLTANVTCTVRVHSDIGAAISFSAVGEDRDKFVRVPSGLVLKHSETGFCSEPAGNILFFISWNQPYSMTFRGRVILTLEPQRILNLTFADPNTEIMTRPISDIEAMFQAAISANGSNIRVSSSASSSSSVSTARKSSTSAAVRTTAAKSSSAASSFSRSSADADNEHLSSVSATVSPLKSLRRPLAVISVSSSAKESVSRPSKSAKVSRAESQQ